MIQSVQKAITLLNILSSEEHSPVPLKILAEKAGIPKPTCAHIIATLEAEGYAVKVSSTKGYILGPAAYCLSRFGRYKSDFIMLCRPILEHLHADTNHTVILAVLEGSSKYIIDYIDEQNILATHTEIIEDDIYRTATGRAILTNLPEHKIYEVYKKYGNPKAEEWSDVSSLKELIEALPQKQEVTKTRNFGDGSVNIGFGAAVFNCADCVGAVGIAVKISEQEESAFTEEEARIKQVLQKGAAEISRRLSYR